jgi:hypothetical protein
MYRKSFRSRAFVVLQAANKLKAVAVIINDILGVGASH